MPLACPRDGSDLDAAGTGQAFRCDRCAGAFLADARMRAVLREASVNASGLATAPPAALPCPACARPMEARLLGGAAIDLCAGCEAAWFDAGELDRIRVYLRDPYAVPRGPGNLGHLEITPDNRFKGLNGLVSLAEFLYWLWS